MTTHSAQDKRKGFWGRLTTLAILVGFVFVILLVSFAAAVVVLFVLIRAGIMPSVSNNNLLAFLVFMVLVSLGIGTVMAGLGGTLMIRPLRSMIEATNQVRAGNFGVRVEPRGTFEMQRLAESFNDMARELSSVETLQNDFVNTISHEFKTPVVSIRGFAKLLKKRNLTQEKRDEYLDVIILESQRMARLSSNVLLLSKLDNTAAMPDIAPYALDEQLRRAVLMMEPEAGKKKITMEVDLEPAGIYGSEEMLQHVWLNLLSNAVKFTPGGGRVAVVLRAGGAGARVTVRDSGIGMDAAVKGRLFDKFYQADRSRTTDGNGLGLSLAQRIVHLAGGHITVESEPGQGAAFTVELPARPAAGGGDENLF